MNFGIIPQERTTEKINRKSLFGNDLLSQAVTRQVPSALTSLTSGFGMGPGVSSSLESPKRLISLSCDRIVIDPDV